MDIAELVRPYFQGFADSRHSGTRHGPVHLLVKDSEAALCGTRPKRWNQEGETDDDYCSRCLKVAKQQASILTKQGGKA